MDLEFGNEQEEEGWKKGGTRFSTLEDTPLGNDAKQRRISASVMWYLPVVDRLRRMFLNPKEAALMTWCDDGHMVVDDCST